MGETAKLMNRYIAGLAPGQLFTTRECLPFGSRAAIDQKLFRLVKAGFCPFGSRCICSVLSQAAQAIAAGNCQGEGIFFWQAHCASR